MSGTITAIGVGVAGIAAGAIEAGQGRSAARDAANAQAQGQQNAIGEQQREYDQTRADQAIYRNVGGRALNRLNNASDGNLSSFQTSPNYAFTRSEGDRGVQQSAAAQGGLYSGNALKALTQYNSNLASGQYNNWFGQQAQLAGVGQAATNATDQLGQQTANQIGQAYGNQGDARASGIIGGANSFNSGINSGLQNAFGAFNSYNNLQNGFQNQFGQNLYGAGGSSYGGLTSPYSTNAFANSLPLPPLN